MPVSKREATAILSSLSAGVVPRTGLRHIAVGRLREIQAIQQDLDRMRDGGAATRFIVGPFGSGKSFLLQLVRSHALESKFVVADADFTPDRRLQGTNGQALATYRELITNLSTQTRPDGNALPAIIERWISNIQTTISLKQGLAPNSAGFTEAVKTQIMSTINAMEELVHGFDFGNVIIAYYQGYITGNDDLKSNAIRWLRGEFGTKTEAREAIGVRTVIDDNNYYDYLKVIARFAHDVGYAGLMVCLDEGVNLYKITHSAARNSNYERMLAIVNDCLQGRASYLGFMFSGTPEFLEDQRRGVFSYEALRSRLAGSRFANDGLRDFSGPVLTLPPLTPEETYVLLQKVRDIHHDVMPGSPMLDDSAIIAYMEESLRRIGATEFATPRDMVREFVNLMNLLVQYPDKDWRDILAGITSNDSPNKPSTTPDHQIVTDEVDTEADPLDRFTNFRVS
jgi:hypothetical protein